MTLENDGKKSEDMVTVCLPQGWPEKLAQFELLHVSGEGETAHALNILSVEGWSGSTGAPPDLRCANAHLPVPLYPGSKMTLRMKAVFTHVFTPRPATIREGEFQRFVYTDTIHIVSPYEISSETTEIITGVEPDSHDAPDPSKYVKSSEALVLGKYSNIKPFSTDNVSIHFVNESPFSEARSVERTIRLSHWSGIHVTEEYDIQHGGAKYVGRWSRATFLKQEHARGGPISRFSAMLPDTAHSLIFKDRIGNIYNWDTIHNSREEKTYVKLIPRYPLYGGWETKFKFGYSIPLKQLVSSISSNKYEVKLSVLPSISGLVSDEVVLKILLPEGAHSPEIQANFDSAFSIKKEKSYLVRFAAALLKFDAVPFSGAVGAFF